MTDDNMKPKEIIICDIDGTIANLKHRLPYIKDQNPKDWDRFFGEVHLDDAVEIGRVVQHILWVRFRGEILYITGRPERTRKATKEWLVDNNFLHGTMLMRLDGDHRPAHEVKAELFDNHMSMLADIHKKIVIVAALEDDPKCIEMYQERGVDCITIHV